VTQTYWKKVLGIPAYKWDWYLKYTLYKLFGLTLPKLKDQRHYWERRGQVYMDEILSSGYLDRERFFQDMLVDALRQLEFDSIFEAGCGFGWNLKRIKETFPDKIVAGVDFSSTQLQNARRYLGSLDVALQQADICEMPLPDDAYDIGFSVGVFMNIHPDKIARAVRQMVRVCRKYIIHIEYDQDNTTERLRQKRAFKTNIVSHDYRTLYRQLGCRIVRFHTYRDFGGDFARCMQKVSSELDRWEGFEGPEKYIFLIVEINSGRDSVS